MAMPRKVPVDFGTVFPYGAYLIGDVAPVRDYDKSTKDVPVQAVDQDTGLPVWGLEVVDGDPDATKATRTMTVKVAAKVQPVPPPADSNNGPFRQVEFGGMTATAYIDDNGNFSRIAWSLRASEVRAPSKNGKPTSEKAGV